MPSILQRAKKLISTILVTLLFITSTITIFPSSAKAEGNLLEGNFIKAEGDMVFFKCTSDCGNLLTFAAGAVSGSAVTVMATSDTVTLATVGAAVAGTLGNVATAIVTVAPAIVAPTFAAAAPVLVPVAATAAAGYGAYQLWKVVTHDQTVEPAS